MISANIYDAKTNFSRYISYIEDGSQPFIIIKKDNKPVAKIVPYDDCASCKIGIAKNEIPLLNSIEEFNEIDTGVAREEGLL